MSDIIHAFSVMVLKTDLAESVQSGGEELFKRAAFFNWTRDNKGLFICDKEIEDFTNVSAPLGGLEQLQAQSQEQMSAVSGIPIVKLLGIQPAGLNASSEGEIRTFYDWIGASQEKIIRPHLTKVIDFCMLNIWGFVDDEITFSFEPLWSLDEAAMANVRKLECDTGIALVEAGIISQEEERQRIASQGESPYANIDVEDVPDLRGEEEAGLMPEGGGGAARITQGAAEKEGEIDVPNKGEPGAEEGEEPGEDEIDRGRPRAPVPFEEGRLREDYVEGKNPLMEGAAMRDAQPGSPERGSPKNRKLAEKALARQKMGELDPNYLEGANPLLGKKLVGKPLAGKTMNPDHLKEKRAKRKEGEDAVKNDDLTAERNNANPNMDPGDAAYDKKEKL